MKTLPRELTLAVAIYYVNRTRKGKMVEIGPGLTMNGDKTTYELIFKKKTTWDRDADWENICEAAQKYNYNSQACAGTFWFTKNGNTYKIDESTFPLAEKWKVVK
jgi:hypothetical protein